MGDALLLRTAKRIPANVRKVIIEQDMIDTADARADHTETAMHKLYLYYDAYLDANGEYSNWNCPRCRAGVLDVWRKIKPFLQQLEYESQIK